ncbi:hypothetical protein I3842_01G105000 [Carya illinoinensis]|uniref:Uncharacterized protein n=1 Tax=Carya illinoinensis TaxID=32201 RepID=A0A922FYX0_CARIL|nr:hypothetical protein I3842_01G105000 [Carya illinoinensis]
MPMPTVSPSSRGHNSHRSPCPCLPFPLLREAITTTIAYACTTVIASFISPPALPPFSLITAFFLSTMVGSLHVAYHHTGHGSAMPSFQPRRLREEQISLSLSLSLSSLSLSLSPVFPFLPLCHRSPMNRSYLGSQIPSLVGLGLYVGVE